MAKKFNLLGHEERLTRDISSRLSGKVENQKIAMKYGKEYFDGSRQHGYGGYFYDGRWVDVANRLIQRYGLNGNSKFLDVGCAKGFLMHDLSHECPGLSARGIDISVYARDNAWGETKELIDLGTCTSLPYPDNYFDASVAINTIHNVNYDGCKQAILELIRVTKNKHNIFVQVDAYSNQSELELFEAWVLTAQTYMMPDEWLKLFEQVGFEGDYFWTIIGFSG